MSTISTTALVQAVAELRGRAVAQLVAATDHDTSMRLRGEICAYDELVYTLVEKPRLEAERNALSGETDD